MPTGGLARIAQRLLVLTTAIRRNRTTDRPITRSLTARSFDRAPVAGERHTAERLGFTIGG